MEGYCLTGQSPQWTVVPVEEEEEEEEEDDDDDLKRYKGRQEILKYNCLQTS
jgi:hypothetical protein